MVTKGAWSHRLFWLLIAGLLFVPLTRVRAEEAATSQKLNPYTGNAEAIQQGKALYLRMGCSGCHGAGGGGGMGPALLDDEWKFGSDDATLFKLIKGEIPQQTMPATFKDVLKDEEIWQIIAFVRSLYRGDPGKIDW
ncbi:MAG TPA: c-type cytochrome [Candidatus Tectomicrobia bacterium]|jgi:cytochrome c(L)